MSETEAPVWVKYAGDIFFLILFLVIFFFIKPDQKIDHDESSDTGPEAPNPLEAMLVTEDPKNEDSTVNDDTSKVTGDNN